MKNATAQLKKQKTTKWWILTMTLLYLVAFPVLLYASFFSVAVLESASAIKEFFQLIFVFVCFCVPLSIPLSIYFMWRRYFQREYKKAYFYCAVPIVTSIVVYVLIQLVGRFPILN